MIKGSGSPRRQSGINTPEADKQKSVLVIQLDLKDELHGRASWSPMQHELGKLGSVFRALGSGSNQSTFSATLGLGSGFFDKLEIVRRPKHLYPMPDVDAHVNPQSWLISGDENAEQLKTRRGYAVNQSDLIIILAGESDTMVWDALLFIAAAVAPWSKRVDIHEGFRRDQPRNMLGFLDGVSNPQPGSALFDEVVWTSEHNETEGLKDGSYLAFQKLAHDLDAWQRIGVKAQEEWIGRRKFTGLLLGTLTKADDSALAADLRDGVPGAEARWQAQLAPQKDPLYRFFDGAMAGDTCPVWSHVRKSNPRSEGSATLPRLMYRRGCNYVEGQGMEYLHKDIPRDQWLRRLPAGMPIQSGILFMSYQRDPHYGFEYVKRQWMNNEEFPIPKVRHLDENGEVERLARELGELKVEEALERGLIGLVLDAQPTVMPQTSGIASLQSASHASAASHTGDEWQAVREIYGQQTLLSLYQAKLGRPSVGILNLDADNKDNSASYEPLRAFARQQLTGREALSQATRLGLEPKGGSQIVFPLGGGYYFVPPIDNGDLTQLGQTFFD